MKKCECEMCNSSYEEVKRRQEENIERFGFFTHILTEGKPNINTHGLELMDHLNFQVCLDIDPRLAHHLFWDLVNRVKDGKKFKDGDVLDDISNVNVKLKLCKENGRDVLRLLLPDKNNKFPDEEGCDELHKLQLEDTDEA